MEEKSHNKIESENLRKNIFSVPERYFDELPARIQNRMSFSRERRYFSPLPFLKYAFLFIVTTGALIFLIYKGNNIQRQDYLNSVSSQTISEYLLRSDITSDEIIDNLGNKDFVKNDGYEKLLPNQISPEFIETDDIQLEDIESELSNM